MMNARESAFSNLIRQDLKDYCKASNLAFNEHVKKLQSEGQEIYHFGFGEAPFPVIPQLVEALKKYAGEKSYLPVAGLPALKEAIIKFHRHFDGGPESMLQSGNVVIGPGTKQLIYLCMNVFDGEVMVNSPTWTTYFPQARLAHHSPKIIKSSYETEWKITPQAIEECIRDSHIKGNKMLVLCNPDNPTGVCYTEQQLQELAECCSKNKIIVISDEIYSRLHYENSHISLSRFYPEGTIISSGMSKWASAGGWRLGYHIYPTELSELRDAVISAASHTHSCAPAPQQMAVTEVLSQLDVCEAYIQHTTRIMKTVGLFCYQELTSIGVRALPPQGAYYFFPDFDCIREPLRRRGIVSGNQLCEAMLKEANVALMSGGPAFLRPENEFTVRFCFVNFDGSNAYEASKEIGLNSDLPDNFVQDYCNPVFKGISAIKAWVQKVKAENHD